MNTNEILETINMIDNEDLDVRTITMGISLLDCIHPDVEIAAQKVYDKICRYAEHLVKTGEDISKQYGIPIINKRISVTPIAMIAGACPTASPVRFAKALDRAAHTVGVNFIGGYSALVHKGFGPGDYALIESIPQALDETELRAPLSTWAPPKRASTWMPWKRWAGSFWKPLSAPPTGNASVLPSWWCSATLPRTTLLWPAPFTVPGNPTA